MTGGRHVPGRLAAALLLLGAAWASPGRVAAEDRSPFRVAVLATLSGRNATAGQEVLDGVRHAATWRESQGGAGGRRVEVVWFDDEDDPAKAEKAFEAAARAKADAVVAAPGPRAADALAARIRKGKPLLPAVFVGQVPPRPSGDPRDPVLRLAPWPVDEALALVNALVLPCRARKPGLVVEDVAFARDLSTALQRNYPERRDRGPAHLIPPGRAPDPTFQLTELRDGGCDHLVVLGTPALLSGTRAALEGMKWSVPILACDGALSAPAGRSRPGSAPARYLVGGAQLAMEGVPRPLEDSMAALAKGGDPGPIYPATVRAWHATLLLCDAAVAARAPKAGKPGDLVAALRDLRYPPQASRTPVFGHGGTASLVRFSLWQDGEKGPEPVDSGLVPAEGMGPLMGLRKPSAYRAEPGTRVILVTFGDDRTKPARTIEADLAALGLATKGYEDMLDLRLREDLLARVLGKLNRLFAKNEDGTGIPGVSFAVSFVPDVPKDMKPSDVWTVRIAGDDEAAGGRAWPGSGRAEVYATFLRRTIFQAGALAPPVERADLPAVDGTQAWKGVRLEHLRHDQIRSLLDGYAGSMALTGAHEAGHLFGLGHDETEPWSLMNVAEGAGLAEAQAAFIPEHAALIERAAGRWRDPREARK